MTNDGTTNDKLSITVAAYDSAFPLGTAPSYRLRFLGRALIEAGCEFRILEFRTNSADDPPLPACGTDGGIDYEYTAGRTVRGASFGSKVWLELRGAAGLLLRLRQLRREQKCDVIYLWQYVPRLGGILCLGYARAAGIPVVVELNEVPWTTRLQKWHPWRRLSPLTGVVGALVISDALEKWCQSESTRLKHRIQTCYMPPMVDIFESDGAQVEVDRNMVTISCGAGYVSTYAFVLQAMRFVWRSRPECRLVVTGKQPPSQLAKWFKTNGSGVGLEKKILFAGQLARPELLRQYAKSAALLIPLFDDARSWARSPSKVPEYLISGRPVVSTLVGEVARYLTDGTTGYLALPGSARAYGAKILEALSDPQRAAAVGEAGKRVAMQHFHYANYSGALRAFFSDVRSSVGTSGH
jgi:hypothetical protein